LMGMLITIMARNGQGGQGPRSVRRVNYV